MSSPFRFLFRREKAELVLDDTKFKVCEGKVVSNMELEEGKKREMVSAFG